MPVSGVRYFNTFSLFDQELELKMSQTCRKGPDMSFFTITGKFQWGSKSLKANLLKAGKFKLELYKRPHSS